MWRACHCAGLHVQLLSSDGSSGGGVYWMFYSGATFEAAVAPAGLQGLDSGADCEGLR